MGLHCHIGSQVTDASLDGRAIRRMIAAMAKVRDTHGVVLPELNIGGGHGVRYVCGDSGLNLDEFARVVDTALDMACAAHEFPRPRLVIEPASDQRSRGRHPLPGTDREIPAGRGACSSRLTAA